ncbi:MAG: 50S ribosomal protein L11 methyltransferase [Chromatiales bacterium]|nr:50S ribosomal protein L11 methyltransferase [Chromatiales bacterium]
MSWLQLHLTVDKERAPLIELVFENLGALSVTLGDAEDDPQLEPKPGESPLWQQTRVTGLFAGDSDADELRNAINQALNEDVSRHLQLEILQDQAWERAWMDAFHPMQFGKRLWICPTGQQVSADNAVIVDLDPGLAFGTGTHPTTALCLSWLDNQSLAGKTVIDFGCGSGILAVAALLLGAESAIAIDHDPQALEATLANAQKNGVEDRLIIHDSEQPPEQPCDILLANILASTLVDLEPLLASLTKPGGEIALSGILHNQTLDVLNAYQGDFKILQTERLEEWMLIAGQRLSS